MYWLIFATFLWISFAVCVSQLHPLVTVNTPRGRVVGYHIDQGNDTTHSYYGVGDEFLGIPFALPPVGELRFRRPVPLTKYPGTSTYNATDYRKACVQPNKQLEYISEDCLYVNIWTPNATSTTKYPVMVWIHGGGLITGSSHLDQGHVIRNFVSKGIVVASLEYRMSWLGFFTTFTDDFPPNLGMLDQVLALKFIKEEISFFGGDPNRITIFGESAGGHSVSSHTYSPLSQNLFQQVIMESGTVLTCYDAVGPTHPSYYMAKYACNYTDEMWNSGNFGPLKDCLMKIDVQDGLDFETKAMSSFGNRVCWNMVQDNYFFPGSPQNLGKLRPNIPAIIGTCKDEYSAWELERVKSDLNLTTYTKQGVEERLAGQYASWFKNQSQAALQIFEDVYLPSGTADDDHMAWLQFAVDVGTPAYFTWGALRDVEYYLANNNPNVYAYEFAWSSVLNNNGNPLPDWAPVPHGCEVVYVFSYYTNWNETDKVLANQAQETWTNFVKYGKPTLDGSWKPTTSKDYTKLEYFEFNNVSTSKIGYRAKDQVAWNQRIPPVLGDSPVNTPDNQKLCTRGYQSKIKNTTCYEAFGSSLSWNDAQTSCGTSSYGSLVTIGSAFENSDLLAYAQNAYPSCTGFYVGLFQSEYVSNNNWLWANYDLSNYRNWKSGYPIINSNASCVVLNPNDGSWTNQACDIPQCYICSY